MEATARTPGHPGSTDGKRDLGGHVHQVLALAAALSRAAVPTPAHTPGSDEADCQYSTLGTPFGLDLGSLSDASVVDWAQNLEHLGRFLVGMQVQAAGELADRALAGRFEQAGVKNPAELLTVSLNLSKAEANRRLRLAEHFLPSTNFLTAVTTPPAQPALGAAFFAGDVSSEQALIISAFTDEASHLADAGRIPEDKVRELEETLTVYATNEPPDFLRRVGLRAVNLLDPDGQRPTEGELLAKQGIFFHHARRGMVHFDGHMTVAQYETTMAFIGSSTNPANHTDFKDITPDADPDCATDCDSGGTGVPEDALLPGDARNHRTAMPGDAAMPGQMDITDFVRLAGAGIFSAGPEAAGRAAAESQWPPPQGPIPEWARRIPEEPRGECEPEDPGSDSGPHEPAVDSTPDQPPPWPHLVNGIPVPEPGSGEDLPGLDPIDPRSTDPAVQDRRTHGQKLLDGLIDCLGLAARTGKLPMNGGAKAQLFISTTQAELDRKNAAGESLGIALAPYCGPQQLAAFEEALCDADVTRIILGDGSDILNVGRTQRLFTAAQRKILIARDMGCTFPDCTAPAYWTEAHHIIPWKDGGETNISNGALLCCLHHHLVHQGAWTVRLDQGVPLFTPQFSLDPLRRERRNTYHHGLAKA
ncbi:HNH endonuclease signature motif containing protein [Arthrobacter sp. ERGS1:01]|uniref:HNH endonuclease signature motif containing protein n=1 Tax=Arthrobacter sp. ERGS1:01 TaxID=1704044 RepID=UPI0006B48668|nr:HNH endonuclease signature motif containing protein [Arthrobacter sp. ERGS1:01]